MTPEQIATSAATITAIATVIYTCGTFLLWKTNRDNLKALQRQSDIIFEQVKHQVKFNQTFARWTVLDAHRDIWLPVISNPNLTNLLLDGNPSKENVIAAEFLGSILINHCYRIFVNFHNDIFDESEFAAFARDARNLFSYALVRWRWKEVSKYHSDEFIRFVNDNIIS